MSKINFSFLNGKKTHANLKTFKAAHKPRFNHMTEVSKISPANPRPLHSQAERRHSTEIIQGVDGLGKWDHATTWRDLLQEGSQTQMAMSMKRPEQANPRQQKEKSGAE